MLAILPLVAGCTFRVADVLAGTTIADDGGSSDAGADASVSPPTDGAPADIAPVVALRKPITVDNTKVNGPQTDFPLWIDLVDADLGAHAQANGQDIFFTAADGTTNLDYQIQSWDPSGHHLSAWVRVPMLNDKMPTVLYLNYGDPSRASAPNPSGVFKSGFAAVWHLDDALPASTIADATGTHAGTPVITTTTRVPAKLGSGFQFTGGTDTITFTNMLTGNQPHTISVWVSQPAVTHVSAVLVVGSPMNNQSRWFYPHYTSAALSIGFYANDWVSTTNLDGAGWTLVHWVYEGNNNKSHLYVNGVEIPGSPNNLNNVNTQGTTGIIGHAPEPAYGTNTGLQATIDELRIATVVRSAGFISTEFANQSSPGTFYAVGTEQPQP